MVNKISYTQYNQSECFVDLKGNCPVSEQSLKRVRNFLKLSIFQETGFSLEM